MVETITAWMKPRRGTHQRLAPKAVLLAGGFHVPAVARDLQRGGVCTTHEFNPMLTRASRMDLAGKLAELLNQFIKKPGS